MAGGLGQRRSRPSMASAVYLHPVGKLPTPVVSPNLDQSRNKKPGRDYQLCFAFVDSPYRV